MANWKHMLKVNAFFKDGVPDPIDEADEFVALRDNVHAYLIKANLFPADALDELKQVRSTKGFENAMNRIYDYADRNLIWMGL